MCFSLPAVRALKASEGEITILCSEDQARFWKSAGFENLVCYPAKISARALAKQLIGIERALIWESGLAADALTRASVSERIGLPAAKLEKQLTHKLERRVVPGPPEHLVQTMLDTAELMGAQPLQGHFFQPIKHSIPHEDHALLLSPESDFGPNYEWNIESWCRVTEWLTERGWTLHIGKLKHGGLADQLAEKTGAKLQAIDLTDPADYGRYPLCLSADSSLPHLAGAFGAVCAVLFGPGDPVLTRPLSQRHHVIRKKVECSPCFLTKCPIDLRCQNDLDVERVIEQLRSLSPA